jgi:hypothetical protein
LNVESEGTIELQHSDRLLKPRVFCVSGDDTFFIPDYTAGDIKIYSSSGELLNVYGRKGMGPNEFSQPAFCFVNDKKFGVMDFGRRKIFLYHRQDKKTLVPFKDLYCLGMGFDIQVKGSEILVSGYKADKSGHPFAFYSVNLQTENVRYLLPAYYKYGLESLSQYKNKYLSTDTYGAIGIAAFFDLKDDYAYYVWQGDLKILKIHLKTGKFTHFGMKTLQYVKPFASKRILEARMNHNFKVSSAERKKMSYVKAIFTNNNYVMLIYNGRGKSDDANGYILQFYTFDGMFLKEVSLPGDPTHKWCFNKRKNKLYSLTSRMDEDLNEEYYILKYKITR